MSATDARTKLLAVDDSEANRVLMRSIFDPSDYEVFEANNIIEGCNYPEGS